MVTKKFTEHDYIFFGIKGTDVVTQIKHYNKKLSRDELKLEIELFASFNPDLIQPSASYSSSRKVTYAMPDEQFLKEATIVDENLSKEDK